MKRIGWLVLLVVFGCRRTEPERAKLWVSTWGSLLQGGSVVSLYYRNHGELPSTLNEAYEWAYRELPKTSPGAGAWTPPTEVAGEDVVAPDYYFPSGQPQDGDLPVRNIQYRPISSREFILYSVGPDGIDNGASIPYDETLRGKRATGDIVLRCNAETQTFVGRSVRGSLHALPYPLSEIRTALQPRLATEAVDATR